jgi:hypothetical protein
MAKRPDVKRNPLDKRVLEHRSSVKKLFDLMSKAARKPQSAPPGLLAACRTQSAFANLSLPAHKITPMSLNTLKALADLEAQSGGWSRLNEIRVELKALFPLSDRSRQPAKNRTERLQAEIEALKAQLADAYRARSDISSLHRRSCDCVGTS